MDRVCVIRQDKGDGELSQVSLSEAYERLVERGYYDRDGFNRALTEAVSGNGSVTLLTDWAIYHFVPEGADWPTLGGKLQFMF